jgi:hypothetical protein
MATTTPDWTQSLAAPGAAQVRRSRRYQAQWMRTTQPKRRACVSVNRLL